MQYVSSMPFDHKYSPEVREAATARVLERRATHPKDQHVLTVVAEEFNVGQQSLRAWVAAATPDAEKPARKTRRPKFSTVVTTSAEAGSHADVALPEPAPAPITPSRPASSMVATLEAEAAELRQGNETLKNAMRVLLAV